MSDLKDGPQAEANDASSGQPLITGKEDAFEFKIERVKEILLSKTAILTIAACLVGAVLIGGSINYYNYINSGYAVKYNDKLLGYVRDKGDAVQAFSELKEEIKKYDQSITINDELRFEKVLIDADKLGDAKEIIRPIGPGLYEQFTSYAVSINGEEMAVLKTEEEAKGLIEGLRKYFESEESKTGAQVLNVSIKDDIKITQKVSDSTKIVDASALMDKLLAGKGVTKKYEVKDGDSLWRIASNNNMDIDQIMAVNPGVDPELLQIGQFINLSVSEPYINVEMTIKAVYDEDIPYDTKYVDDGNLYKGQTRVVESGESGINKVEKQVTKLNGKLIASTVLSTVVAKNPVIRVLARGTKELVGSGRFLWPINGHITSAFGSRGREYHQGLDIGAPIGTPIAAADSGTVIYSGRYYDYGKMVMIDHGNGYVTYYAHCSTLYVNEGDTVKKGQQIAAVGMTGWTTGPHLHFEVRLNGSPQNPMRYFD